MIASNFIIDTLFFCFTIREELLRRYPDVMVGMGRSKDLGQTGPDDAGDKLTKTTIKVCESWCIFVL